MHLEARVNTQSERDPIPRPGFDIAACFASPERNRPLLINNGQRLHLSQIVDLAYAGDQAPVAKDPPSFDQQVAGVHATINWKHLNAHAWSRVVELTVDQPLISQADYAAVRQMLRNWNEQLTL